MRRTIRTGTSTCPAASGTCRSCRKRPSTTSSAAPPPACSSCRRATTSSGRTSRASAMPRRDPGIVATLGGRSLSVIALLLIVAFFLSAPALAQDAVENFYRGRQVNLTVGYGPGGGYDTAARLLALSSPLPSRQSRRGGAEHAWRRQPARGQLPLLGRAPGWHDHRPYRQRHRADRTDRA